MAELREENEAAKAVGVKWQHRGPPPDPDVPLEEQRWRGLRFRPGSGKWMNRGGANKEWHTAHYVAKKQGKAAVEAFLKANPHPSMKKDD